ncbi:hypothetical protein WR25_08653 [Diploscapter pachys]|uniref:Fungal lipase-type domain-containing protein n=1 Tax=Diploscapter pachys TaxID=2018661 RepID=A0A2A2LNT1_9BILA|nr:hypothetical protein WR25_08653 [Diploscapter pachys]
MVLGMMEDFKLGGKMLSYYNRVYNDMIEQEFETILRDSIQKYPTYQPLTCGHSLGGTLATIFSLHIAMNFNVDVIEYAWPDTPFRISQNLPNPHHTSYEVIYADTETNDLPIAFSGC